GYIYPTLRFELWSTVRGSSSGLTLDQAVNISGPGSGDKQAFPVNVTFGPGRDYIIVLRGLSRPNALQFYAEGLSISQIDYGKNCSPPTPRVRCQITVPASISPNQRFNVDLQVTNLMGQNLVFVGGNESRASMGLVDPGSSATAQSRVGQYPPTPDTTTRWRPLQPRSGTSLPTFIDPADGGTKRRITKSSTVTVANNSSVTFNFTALAPGSTGTYSMGYRLLNRDLVVDPWFPMSPSDGCIVNINVTNSLPTCIVLGLDPLRPQIRQNFRVGVRINNPNPGNIALSAPIPNYVITNNAGGALVAGTDGVNLTGNANVSVPQNLASGNTDFYSDSNIQIYQNLVDFKVNWTITTNLGTINCGPTGSSDGDTPGGCDPLVTSCLPDVTYQVPICTISSKNVTVGIPFTISVSIQNPNTFAAVTINNGSPDFSMSNGQSGEADPTGGWTGPGYNLTGGSTVSFTSVPPPTLVIGTIGVYTVDWSFTTSAGDAGGDCGPVGATKSAVIAFDEPYTRFYGNDVVAGGSFKVADVCSPSAFAANISAFGAYNSGTQNHSSYIGAAAELAVFATGTNHGVLPGSQVTSRTALGELAFANSVAGAPVTASTTDFGGAFDEQLCVSEVPAASGTDLTSASPVTLDALTSGTYQATGPLAIDASSIANGNRPIVIVNGDLVINGDITYSGAGSWSAIEQIPLVRLYANNIYVIGGSDRVLDGMYVARDGFYTCSNGTAAYDFATSTAAYLAACRNKLTVNGAVIAKRIYPHRAVGNLGAGTVAEGAGSGNVAEVFNFSPELYLALIAEGRSNVNGKFDAILSLPPAF
ncbi:hypothetical protein KC959_02090, partial [Candidatus Saccharibacteria bacterium]|nr:hypothetical protein [Candidatus Saccharibacteria bacterium]